MRNSPTLQIFVFVLVFIYLILFIFARNGYGYMGYRGFYTGHSWWYWGGPSVYYEPSNRSGSLQGTSRLGGGPGSGK